MKAPNENTTTVVMCKCGKNPATPEMHRCPYQAEINDNDTDFCNCCSDCSFECAMDI